MIRSQSATSNKKLIQCWVSLESALRDGSQVTDIQTSQKNRANTSKLFKQYADFTSTTVKTRPLIRPQSSQTFQGTGNFFGNGNNKRPLTGTINTRRPLTALPLGIHSTTHLQSHMSSVKNLLNLKVRSRPHTTFGTENIHVPKEFYDIDMDESQFEQILDSSEQIHTIQVDKIIDLFNSKCIDTKQKYQPNHAVKVIIHNIIGKFIEKIKKQCDNQRMVLNECQFGPRCAEVLKDILMHNSHFYYVNLSKNSLGDEGLITIIKAITRNHNLIHLDVSSNRITPHGAHQFFTLIQRAQSLISIDISSRDGLNRNRIGVYGCEPLEGLLMSQHPLQFLNLRSTAIGASGFECILSGLQCNTSLVSLNVSSNDLNGYICSIIPQCIETTQLEELILQDNQLGNTGAEHLSRTLMHQTCKIKRLDITNCNIKSLGIMKLFTNLHSIGYLTLDGNFLSGNGFQSIEILLQSRCPLEYLSCANCEISMQGVESLGRGLQKNNSLRTLILRGNRVGDLGGEEASKGLMLEYLDLRSCKLSDSAALHISNLMSAEGSRLHTVLLGDNDIHDSGGALVVEAVRNNSKLLRLDLTQNPMDYKYVMYVDESIKSNLLELLQNRVPHDTQQVEQLTIFADERFTVVRDAKDLQQKQLDLEKERSTVAEAKVHLKEQQADETNRVEQQFNAVMQEYSKLMKLNMEDLFRDESDQLDDDCGMLLRNKDHQLQQAAHFEREIKSIKDQMKLRKYQLDQKVDQLKRELNEKNKILNQVQTEFKSIEAQMVLLIHKNDPPQLKLKTKPNSPKTSISPQRKLKKLKK